MGEIAGAILIAVIIAAGGILVAWLNNGKKLMERVNELTGEVIRLQEEAVECHKREADLKAEVSMLTSRVRNLEQKTGTIAPSPIAGIVVARLDGTIVEYSPALTVFLKWTPMELKDRPVITLVPPRLRAAHLTAFSEAVKDISKLDPNRYIVTYALAKDGMEIPVTINLRGWRSGNEGLITATIQERATASV